MEKIKHQLKSVALSSLKYINGLPKIPETHNAKVHASFREINGGKQFSAISDWGPNFIELKRLFLVYCATARNVERLFKSVVEEPAVSTKLPFGDLPGSSNVVDWLWHSLILPWLTLSPLVNGKFVVKEALIDETVETIIASFQSDTFVLIRQVSPLLNFAVDEEVELSPGIKLRRPTEDELAQSGKETSLALAYLAGTGSVIDISYEITTGGRDRLRQVELPCAKPANLLVGFSEWSLHCYQEAVDNRNTLLRCLRLLVNRPISIRFTKVDVIGALYWTESTAAGQDPLDISFEPPVLISHDDVNRLLKIWRRLREEPALASMLQIPLKRWGDASERWQMPLVSSYEDVWKDVLIDYWIGLESLFAPESAMEITYRASLRIAAFIGKDPEEKKHLLKQMKESYGWRSKIVHGSKKTPSDKLRDIVNITGQCLRMSLLRILETREPFAPERIEERLLATLPTNPIDN